MPLNEPKRNDLAPFVEARRQMQRSRLLRVSKQSPLRPSEDLNRKGKNLPYLTTDQRRRPSRNNAKLNVIVPGSRCSSQCAAKATAKDPAKTLYQKMEWAQKTTLVDQIQRSNLKRKEVSGGRFNRTFQGKTPSIKDPDIRALITQYPLHAEDDEEDADRDGNQAQQESKAPSKASAQYAERYRQIQQLDRLERNKLLRKEIEFLGRHVDHINTEDQKVYRNHIHKMVLNDFRCAEMSKVTDLLREIEFAEPIALYGMFDYRQKTALERLAVEAEVLKEYRGSELDP